MKQTLQSFEEQLRDLIGAPTDLRPFVCDGSPLECRAFIVGFNPATAMSADFWQFWRSGHGFDKAAWFGTYIIDRRDRPLRPGQTRRNPISNTRRVIDWILEEANPIRCLETNIYSAPTEQATDLPSRKRITAPFDFLVAAIRPRVILTHGDKAEEHIRSKHLSARIISVSHFSRGWSEERARELGNQIKSAVESD